jgi:diguanylate cyclase (GGDEF)-like protein
MRIFPEKYRILAWISALLLAGFLTTSIAAYLVSRNAVQRAITEQALPLASDSLHAEIRAELLHPTVIASMMANDSFVRDWLRGGETDSDAMPRYLDEIRKKHGAVTAFLISDRTRRYYYAEGILKTVQENDAQDGWFFRLKENTAPFVSKVDIDRANRNAMTVLINHRMLDRDGTFLGVTGVGLRMDRLTGLIDSYEQQAGRRVYVIDSQRKLVLAGASMKQMPAAIDSLPGLREIARELLHGGAKPVLLQYRHDNASVFVMSRYIPELGWHLLVEQNTADEVRPVRNAFMLILAIGAGVTLLALMLTLFMVKRYQSRLELMAGTDTLTGLLNRQAFEIVFRQAMLEADRSGRPLSGILFDVDFFKTVNDMHGHLVGDEVLRTISRISKGMLRESDIITRWGGEEFVVLLKECPVEQAVGVAEKLRYEIDHHDFSAVVPDRQITISLGVAQHEIGETATIFFDRIDEALYKAKANGRNRLHVARSGGLGGNTATVVS